MGLFARFRDSLSTPCDQLHFVPFEVPPDPGFADPWTHAYRPGLEPSPDPECPVAAHTDLGRQVERLREELDLVRGIARQRGQHIRLLEAANTSLLRRLQYVESRLHHPAGKGRDQQDAA